MSVESFKTKITEKIVLQNKGEKLKMNKNQNIAFALLLIFFFGISLIAIPETTAHTPKWTIISYAYIVAAPDPIGVGQTAAVISWIDTPLPGSTVTNNIRRHDYTLTITKPDNTVQTQHWDVLSDTTGLQYYQFVPDQIGTYTFKFDYPGETYTWSQVNTPGLDAASAAYQNDTYLGATASTTLTVQGEPLPAAITSYPLPTEYWTRPIEGQNTDWYTIASNWLGTPYIIGANPPIGTPGGYQTDGKAPNTSHIMWTKPIQYGGIVGGNETAVLGEMYYQGSSYNIRWNNPLIIQGTLFYQEPWGNSGTGGDYLAVDLRTGETLWKVNTTATGINLVPSFGYLYSYESPNQHGILPNGLLIAPVNVAGQGTVWRSYDPRTGYLTTMNVTNVPSGVSVAGPLGEYLIYVLTNLGTASNPQYYLMQWNSSNVFGGGSGLSPTNWYSGTVNASLPSAFDWNISLSTLQKTGWAVQTGGARGNIPLISVGNMLLLIQGASLGGHPGDFPGVVTLDTANITAISLKPNSRGQVLWTKSFPPAEGNNTRFLTAWDPSGGVFIHQDKESMVHWGYSLTDGSLLWGPKGYTDDFTNAWNYLTLGNEILAYGKLYVTGYSGILYCYDEHTGDLLWTYGNGGEGNSTLSGFETPYGRYPLFISSIADGKVYLDSTEHSPNSPLWKNAKFRAINATDGTELWNLFDFGNAMYGGVSTVADGYLTFFNTYDCQLYTVGKGPSALTIETPSANIELGSGLTIKGTVTDIAAGTKQKEQAARFPNGVPAVSDNSMDAWMKYVYQQKPRPTDATGVPVTISVVDTNGNYRDIGTVTNNADGFYSLNWKPDIEGTYTVYASFAGSESYWPSHAVSAFAVDSAAATPAPTQILQPNLVTTADLLMYLAVGVVAIIIAIAIIGLLLLRKRP